MFNIIDDVRSGNEMKVRLWLDDTEHDPNLSDDHRFSLLHWASKCGHASIVRSLIEKGARVNVSNMGDDTPLHLAAAHNCREIADVLINSNASLDAVNEHGNTPLHYACFWNYQDLAEDLIAAGASATMENGDGDTPLDKARPRLSHLLDRQARAMGQQTNIRVPFRENWQVTTSMRTRSRDPTLSRAGGFDIKHLKLYKRICVSHGGDVWSGEFRDTEVVVKSLRIPSITKRHSRDFAEECPQLRIFNHANILPLLANVSRPTALMVISQKMPYGSLHNLLHHGGECGSTEPVLIDTKRTLQLSLDIARGMDFLHSPELKVLGFYLNSKHILVDEELTAKLNMADNKFSFHEKSREYNPAWMSPESLRNRPKSINRHASDMWSFGVILWELETREEPFAELSPMEIGMQIATENLRIQYPPGFSRQKQTMIKICLNESPGKRPKFDQIIPILEKMKKN